MSAFGGALAREAAAAASGAAESVARTARREAARFALVSLAALFAVVAVGFLTAALWLWIAARTDSVVASAVVGLLFLGVSAILLGAAQFGERKRRKDRPAPPAADADRGLREARPYLDAFAMGCEAGSAAAGGGRAGERGRRRPRA